MNKYLITYVTKHGAEYTESAEAETEYDAIAIIAYQRGWVRLLLITIKEIFQINE